MTELAVAAAQVAWTLFALGYPDQAIGQVEQGVDLARKLAHPMSETWALTSAATVHQLRGEPQPAQERAEAAMGIAKNRGYARLVGWARVLRGWALFQQGGDATAIAEMRKGIEDSRATGARLLDPYWLALLASVHGQLGQAEDGLAATAVLLQSHL